MPTLQVSPATESAAHAAAQDRIARRVPTAAEYCSQLQATHAAAKARARKVCQREPGVISKYDLGDILAELELAQIIHGQLGHFAEAITLNSAIAKLKTLIPV